MTDTTKEIDYIVATDATTTADVAADIGNARSVLLIRTDQDPTPIVIQLPSVRSLHGAFSYEVFAARGMPAASWGKLTRDEHIIERDGLERFVGRLAVERSQAASSGRGSDARYYDGTTLDFILAGVAAALPSANKIVVKLTTMVPISLWHLAPKVEAALKGAHQFKYNGRELTVIIRSIVVRREAEAAFDALEGDVSGPVIVIDGGGRTVNVALFRDGEFRSGATLELGVQAALDNLDTALIGRGLRRLSLAERDELETALISGIPYGYIVDGKRDQIEIEARRQLDATARALCQELRAKVPIDQARRLVFVGGAAHGALFGNVAKTELPHCETNSLRELGNVYGAMGAVPVKKGKKK